MKKFMPKLLVLSLVVALATTCLAGCSTKDKGDTNPVANASFVNLDINPNIDLVVDSNNKVVSVVANNEDAENLLVNVDIKGKDVKVAVNLIVDQSVKDGYINENNTDVNVSAINAKGEKYDKLAKEVKTQAEKTFNEAKKTVAALKNLSLEVYTDVVNSVNARIEATKKYIKENGDKAAQKAAENLEAGKLLLMETVNEITNGAIAMEELVKMEISELNEVIYNIGQNVKTITKDAVEQIEKKTNELVIELQDRLIAEQEAAMKAFGKSKVKAAYDAKCVFVAAQKTFVKAINYGNEQFNKLTENMQTAPNTLQGKRDLNDMVEELAGKLYQEDKTLNKDTFKAGLKESVDGEVRYTYKSVATKLEKQYDKMDANHLTADGLIIKGYVEKLAEFRANTKLSETAKTALKAAQTVTTAAVNTYVLAVNTFNEKIGAAKYDYAEKNFTTLNELVAFTSNILTKQNANIEVAFDDYLDKNATAEEKAALEEHKAAINEIKAEMAKVKDEAIKSYEATLKAAQNA